MLVFIILNHYFESFYLFQILILVNLIQLKEKLEVQQQDLDYLIEKFTDTNKVLITRMLITLLYRFSPEHLHYTLKKAWSLFEQKKYEYLSLIGPLLLGSHDLVEQILTPAHLQKLIAATLKKLECFSPAQQKLTHLLYLLHCVAQIQNPAVNGPLRDALPQIYGATKKQFEIRELGAENFELLFKLTKDLIVRDADARRAFIQKLIADLCHFNQKNVVTFTQAILVPILNGQDQVPVCLHPYYPENRKLAYEGFCYSIQAHEKDLQKSALLDPAQAETLAGFIQPLMKGCFKNNRFCFRLVEALQPGKTEHQINVEKVYSEALGRPPFLVVGRADFDGKRVTVGVFVASEPVESEQEEEDYDEYSMPIQHFPEDARNFVFIIEVCYVIRKTSSPF